MLLTVRAQNLGPSIIAADGGVAKSAAISLDWTLGEFAVETISTTKNLYTQGFHQPILTVKSFHSPPQPVHVEKSHLNIVLFPNPVQSYVTVSIGATEHQSMSLSLFDLNGKELLTRQAIGKTLSVRIEMGRYKSGVYLLDIRDKSGSMVRAFKIVKAD